MVVEARAPLEAGVSLRRGELAVEWVNTHKDLSPAAASTPATTATLNRRTRRVCVCVNVEVKGDAGAAKGGGARVGGVGEPAATEAECAVDIALPRHEDEHIAVGFGALQQLDSLLQRHLA